MPSFAMVLPHLQQVRALGCQTLVECTPAYLGRDARLLQRLSSASGVHHPDRTPATTARRRTSTLPAFAFAETAEQLAARWIREAERGIDDTGIKPAFMKIGVDAAPLSEIDAKLVRAAARTHRETGLPIASHTGTGAAAMAELDLLEADGVPPSAFIWVHAQSERDDTFHVRAARRGAWVEFDGISPSSRRASPRARAAHEDRGAVGPRARVARRRLVPRRRAGRRAVPSLYDALHRFRAGHEERGILGRGSAPTAGRESPPRPDGRVRPAIKSRSA